MHRPLWEIIHRGSYMLLTWFPPGVTSQKTLTQHHHQKTEVDTLCRPYSDLASFTHATCGQGGGGWGGGTRAGMFQSMQFDPTCDHSKYHLKQFPVLAFHPGFTLNASMSVSLRFHAFFMVFWVLATLTYSSLLWILWPHPWTLF